MAREISEFEMTEGSTESVGEMSFESAIPSSLKSLSSSTGSYHSTLSAMPDVQITVHDDEKEEEKDQSEKNFKRFVTAKEFFDGLTIFAATVISALALQYPGESVHVRKIRGFIIQHVAILYIFGIMMTADIDYKADVVRGFHYARAHGERKVFYEKILVHLFGFLVFLVSLVSAIVCLTESDEIFIYGIWMMTIIMNGTHNLMKVYRSDKKISVVITSAGTKIRSLLKRSRKYPPLGRLLHYEVDPSYRPYNVV